MPLIKVKGQLATGGGVDPFRQRPKTDCSLTEPLNRLDKLLERPGQAIQLSNHETVSGPCIIERSLEPWPMIDTMPLSNEPLSRIESWRVVLPRHSLGLVLLVQWAH